MRKAAIRVFPESHKFLLNGVSMGELLEAMVAQRVPLFVSVKRGVAWRDVYALLAEFPDLVCVICDHGCWGEDGHNICHRNAERLLAPFLGI